MECVECRNTGVTKRGVCPKCPAGQRFLERSDGGIRVAFDPEFARRFTHPQRRDPNAKAAREALERGEHPAKLSPEVRAEYDRAREALGLVEQGADADREADPGRPRPRHVADELELPPPSGGRLLRQVEAAELELLRENVELRRQMEAMRAQLEQLLLKAKTEPEPGQGQ